MSDIKMTNIPSMNVGKTVEKLSNAYCTIIQNNYPIKTMPSVMLWGPPGVGKSQAVRQIAKEIGETTGKTVNVTDVRLLLFNPIDLRGIPTANADKTLAVWLKPQIFQMDASDDIVNILFLDEISAAPQSVQAAAYQITLDRVVGEHKLPDNCIVIAAGNRMTDKSVAFKMPKALANRLMHIEIAGSFNSWKEWAIRSGINEKVLGFLSFRQSYLMGFDSSSDDLAFATPRSWEMV
ncbi:MAG: MoxR family ATPase, partial [Clostridiales bacterium]|nr:MoxR family ATPase [Clostridiales bacterium]